MLNRLCASFHSVEENIAAAGAQQKHYYDRRTRHTAYEPGDLVWVDLPALARQKLSPKWTGPFKVLKRLDSGTGDIGVDYELLDQLSPRAKPKVIHYNRLKPYRSPQPPAQGLPSDSGQAPPPAPRPGPPPLTALSGSRPYIYRGPTRPGPCVPPPMAHVPGNPPLQRSDAPPAQVRDNPTAVARPALVTQPTSGLRTRSGRCVRPPERYRTDM